MGDRLMSEFGARVRLAGVLKVPVAELLGETPPSNQDRCMPDIGDAIHRALTEPAADDTVVDPNLADLVRSAWRRRQGSPRRYSELGSQLPALIRGVQQAQLSATP